jgi:transcriptional regulator with XRE-family HTH domain
MSKIMFNFTKEMAKILRRLSKNANLTQKEVATRMGVKTKYGQGLIAQLEMGRVKNPSLQTIFDYLCACGSSWVDE